MLCESDDILRAEMKKFFLVFSWLLLSTSIVLLGSSAYSFYFIAKGNSLSKFDLSTLPKIQSKEEAKDSAQLVTTVIESEDARDQIIAKFLQRYNSPMQPYDFYGKKIVEIADRYEIDFRLLPAIAMQESNLCKTVNPGAPHNCLGFGIHKSGTLDFDSYEDGFERAGRELKAYYIDKGLVTVEQIESKYTPSSNGSWANSVNQWMAEMRYNDRQLGKENKGNASVVEFAK
jgi:hypothetical protein